MLCLTRRRGESIKIGEDIYVYISSIDNTFVRVAIDAPRNVNIVRTELTQENQEDKSNGNKYHTK